jgi:hypothetical protein
MSKSTCPQGDREWSFHHSRFVVVPWWAVSMASWRLGIEMQRLDFRSLVVATHCLEKECVYEPAMANQCSIIDRNEVAVLRMVSDMALIIR